MLGKEFVDYIERSLFVKQISKEVFYKESGITTASMSQWRSGKHNPSEKAIQKAKAFFEQFPDQLNRVGMHPNFLLQALPDIEFENKKSPTPEGMELNETQSAALDLIMNMSEDQLRKFIQMAEIALGVPPVK